MVFESVDALQRTLADTVFHYAADRKKAAGRALGTLLFLTDAGLSQFIDRLLINLTPELAPVREAFLASYPRGSETNIFTKVRMAIDADEALRSYFTAHEAEIETWFNIISPRDGTIEDLQADLRKLAAKDW